MRSSSFGVFLGYAGLMSWRISLLLHFLRLLIWSLDHWLPHGFENMLYWFRRRFYWRASIPDSLWLSKFFGMYWFLRWLCVGTTKICREKLECKKTSFCSAFERWESHHHASKMHWTQLSLTKKHVECINIWLCSQCCLCCCLMKYCRGHYSGGGMLVICDVQVLLHR